MPNVGLIELEDAETGEIIVLDTRDPKARQMYQQLNLNVVEARRKFFQSNKIDNIEIRTEQSYVEPLIRFFRERAVRDSF